MSHRQFAAGQLDYLDRLNALANSLDRRLTANVLVNGAFQVWQRGTSIASATTVVYGPDRWSFWRGASPFILGATVSRQAGDAPSRYCARVQRDSGNTSTAIMYFRQALTSENAIALRGKRLGLRFKARRGANFSGSGALLGASCITGTGTDQHPANVYTGAATQASSTFALTTSWQTFELDLGTIGGSVSELAFGFTYTPAGTAGAADYFEVTEVQVTPTTDSNVDVGDYPMRSFEEELAACQAYYEKSFPYATAPATAAGLTGAFAFTQVVGASVAAFAPAQIQFRARKRTGPTVTLYNPISANAQIRNQSIGADWSASAGTTLYETGFLVQGTTSAGSAAGHLSYVHWTADAELY